MTVRTLLIDNYDSYTFNLYQLIAQTYGVEPQVLRNDSPRLTAEFARRFDAVIISPGPGRPQVPEDIGRCLDIIRDSGRPVLGVCLGHQALGYLCGAAVGPAPRPRHGHLSRIRHDGGLFAGLPQNFVAVRYHSLCVAEPLPDDLVADAWAEDGVVMGLRHRFRPWFGVQFHPESVSSEHGSRLLLNFRRLVGEGTTNGLRAIGDAADPGPASSATKEQAGGWLLRHRRMSGASAPEVRPPEQVGTVDPEWVFQRITGDRPYAFWLDSSRVVPGVSRFSFLGHPGGPDGEVLRYASTTGMVEVLDPTGVRIGVEPGDIFTVLQRRLDERRIADRGEFPFDLPSGYVGYFGYEMKADCGAPNRHVAETPDAVWMAATRMVALDHQTGEVWLLALCRATDTQIAAADGWLDSTAALLRAGPVGHPVDDADRHASRSTGGRAGPERTYDPERWLSRGRERYLADIRTCLDLLRAGESYEICLTNELRAPYDGCGVELYLRQRRHNPAPYAAYLRLGETQILCSSPERFLRIDRTGVVEAKPIKGTAPRATDPEQDQALQAELRDSPKTRAENLMIVDLLRNDLGQVCEIGSVHVPSFMAVESYATVHQLVSTVRGRKRQSVSPTRIVRACFPGGSMTGAPKPRTMRLLGEIEDRARGVYSGALGFFGLTGGVDLNIVIRTAVLHRGILQVGAGGAIVLGSDPDAEYDEMRLKLTAPLPGWTAQANSVPERSGVR
ncbi:chorismate-binding protein [Micromonospora sp. WMMD975]|uniref:chorismate-binding protein n=1 Tax=Micromonospora sp. WMMD975 TaxID=3016087 RepID=UPI00249CAB10|nr:chorismate-binding protein [Micromonospora sp. WMMD975]WFE32723.1 chorismate-binding protein [Micromonospora sp. WMMD975]